MELAEVGEGRHSGIADGLSQPRSERLIYPIYSEIEKMIKPLIMSILL